MGSAMKPRKVEKDAPSAPDAHGALGATTATGAIGVPARLLVVEDDAINRLSIVHTLRRFGHETLEVVNGRQAVDLLARERVDLVLMDIQMPVMNGLEATAIIRAGAEGVLDPDVLIVALTAYAMKGDREEFLAAGMDEYLTKPFENEELRQVLERAFQLGRKRLDRRQRAPAAD